MNVETCKSIILLAGRDDSQTFSGKNEKYCLSVNGQTIIHHIIESIEKSNIETICIVGQEKNIRSELLNTKKQYVFANPGNSLSESLLSGVNKEAQCINGISRTLALASDLPFLAASTINWLAGLNKDFSDDLIVPQIHREKLLKISDYYQTFYWPMTPDSFKWGDGINFDSERMGSKVSDFIDSYRANWSQTYISTALNRLGMMVKIDRRIPLLLTTNYFSKFLQKYLNTDFVPFSSIFIKEDYKDTLETITGMSVGIAQSPNIDLCLDVDNEWRQNVFTKRYSEIQNTVNEYAKINSQ